MVSDIKAKDLVRLLTEAGWTGLRTRGSHTRYACPTGQHKVTVPDGHTTISAGVHGKVLKAIAGCDCTEGE